MRFRKAPDALVKGYMVIWLSLVLSFQVSGQPEIIAEHSLPILSNTRAIPNANTEGNFQEGNGEDPKWTWRYSHPARVSFIRLHVRGHRFPPGESWRLEIKDGNGAIVDVLTAATFIGQLPNAEAWTKLIWDDEVSVELYSATNPQEIQLAIDQLNYSSVSLAPRAITTGSNDMRDLVKAYPKGHPYHAYGKPTGIVFFLAAHNNIESNCTGFLLTPDLFITNQHCIRQNWQTRSAEIHFGYETGAKQREIVGIDRIELSNEGLDFSLLRLRRSVNDWSVVKIDSSPIQKRQQLVVIGYPNANFKTISVKDCIVESTSVEDFPNREYDFYHLCDTQGGNSGSPVINNDNGRVIGLHHIGIPGGNDRGINLAVKITSILENIRSRNLTLYEQIMQSVQ